jgi:ATP-dependent Clp protease, protease subunit
MWPFRRQPEPESAEKPRLGEVRPALDLAGMRLRRERVVDLTGMIDERTANDLIVKLLYLNSDSSRLPLALRIDSPGGNVTASLAIVETIQEIKPPVYTDAVGMAVGTAALVLACGTPGLRSVDRAARVGMVPIESPSASPDELVQCRNMLAEQFARFTGLPIADCSELLLGERNYTPEEAVWYGFADGIGATYQVMR